MRFTLGVLAQLGQCPKIVVESTTPGATFGMPTAVFSLDKSKFGVEIGSTTITFSQLDGPMVRVFAVYTTGDVRASFKVSYLPNGGDNPGVFIWDFAKGENPSTAGGISFDMDDEKVLHLA